MARVETAAIHVRDLYGGNREIDDETDDLVTYFSTHLPLSSELQGIAIEILLAIQENKS